MNNLKMRPTYINEQLTLNPYEFNVVRYNHQKEKRFLNSPIFKKLHTRIKYYKTGLNDRDCDVLSVQLREKIIKEEIEHKEYFQKKGIEYTPIFCFERACYERFKNVDINKFYGWVGFVDFDKVLETNNKRVQYNILRAKYDVHYLNFVMRETSHKK